MSKVNFVVTPVTEDGDGRPCRSNNVCIEARSLTGNRLLWVAIKPNTAKDITTTKKSILKTLTELNRF